LSDDLESDYDLISNPDQDRDHDHESYTVAELSNSTSYGHVPVSQVHEPPPSQAARERFDTVGLSKEDVQTFVGKALDSSTPGADRSSGAKDWKDVEGRTVRVYVDGLFDGWNAGYARRLSLFYVDSPTIYQTCTPTPPSKALVPFRSPNGRGLLRSTMQPLRLARTHPTPGAMRNIATLSLGGRSYH
jgi:hypothetical protein